MTNEELDLAIDLAACTDDAKLDRLLLERSARIAAAEAQRHAAEAEWLAELDAEIADADHVVTVVLTTAQIDRLDQLLPESMGGLCVMSTRIKGTRAQLIDTIGYLDADTAVDLALPGFDTRTDEELAFAESAVRRSIRSMVRRIRDAIRY